MNEIEYIWAAGFLDGEGCFALTRSSNKRCDETTRNAVVNAVQIRKAPLDRLARAFGGEVRIMRVNNKDQTIWQWTVTGKKVIPIIEAVLPYLCGKQDEARAVLEYARTVGERGSKPGTFGVSSLDGFKIAQRRRIIARHVSARNVST
jgi:hypothetical protein